MSAAEAIDARGDAIDELWELLRAEREAARRADGLALLTLQQMKREVLAELPPLSDAEHEAIVRYAKENLRRIGTLVRCFEGCLDVSRPDTYGPDLGRKVRAVQAVSIATKAPATLRRLGTYGPSSPVANSASAAASNVRDTKA
ncbi:MAG: hypothetical protein AAF938_03335 [Myxococcota bacterium]